MRDLQGQVAFITGGGSGLGEALCRTLGEAGMKVAVADIRHEAAQTVAEKLGHDGMTTLPAVCDVGNTRQAEEAVRRVIDKLGPIDVLINNAAIDRTVSIEELTFDEWDRIMCTNLRGPFVLSKIVLPLMKERRAGQIVNIVSTAAKRAWANAAAYHA